LLEHVLQDDQGDQLAVGNNVGGPTGNKGRSAVEGTRNCGAVVGAADIRAPWPAAAVSAWYVITSPDTVKKSLAKTIEQQITLKIDITKNNIM
jgi:hypothetical protein